MKRFLIANFESSLMARLSRLLTIEGEAGGGDDGAGGGAGDAGGGAADLSTAERALEFWDADDKGEGSEGQGAEGKQGAGEAEGEGDAAAGTEPGKEGQEDGQQQLSDEQLQADPRFQELNSFKEEVQPLMDKYGIPDAKEMDAQLADSKVLYDIMQGKGTPSQLLEVMATAGHWTKEQMAGVAADLKSWLAKNGHLEASQGAPQRGADGKFKDPLEERLDNFEKSQKEERERQERENSQKAESERQTKVFNSFREQVGKLMEGKKIDKEDLDYYGREIRSLIKPEQFNAIIARIEKGNFVDVNKLFEQIYTRESARLKRYADKQVNTATRQAKTQPRNPAGGGTPKPNAGQQKRNLQNRDDRLAAASAEWEK
jgi:hypothetical protein